MKLIYNNKEVANNTKNYNELLNKPLLNSKELIGNVSLNDINVYNKKEVDNLIASTRSVKAVTALPSPLVENTMYYVGPDADNNYHVYLVDSSLTLIDLGMAREESMYKAGAGIEIDSSNNIMADIDYETISLNSEGKIYVPTLEGTKGSNIRPVYLEDGQITPVKQAASGDYKSFVPYVANDGITDIGNFIDYHTNTSTKDYDIRLGFNDTANTSKLAVAGGDATGFIPVTGTMKSVGNNVTPVYVTNGTITNGASSFNAFGATAIPSGADLNTVTYTKPGIFIAPDDSRAQSLSNCPAQAAFRMEVLAPMTADLEAIDNSYRYRVRRIVDWHGREWIQQVNSGSSSTPDFFEWRRIIDSDYTERYLPFCISDNGNAITSRTVTDLLGRTYSISPVANTAIRLSGNGIDNATVIHQTTNILQNGAGSCNLYFAYLYAGSNVIIRYDGWDAVNSVAIQGTKAATADSNGACNVSFFTANNANGYDVDIR